ncbi:MAG: hypothetical protein OJF51_004618 [Nitrospira sp.]|nr:MAG: hypothetical protein OJF51_004618 [Nitrospira sp.]
MHLLNPKPMHRLEQGIQGRLYLQFLLMNHFYPSDPPLSVIYDNGSRACDRLGHHRVID